MSEESSEKPPMRHLAAVIKQLQEVVPEESTEFRELLRIFYNDAVYKPPEMMGELFNSFAFYVSQHVGPPPLTEDWKIKAVAIWMNIGEDQARTQFGPK